MERKKIILVAVLINAGLLAVLFVASLTTQEEVVSSQMGFHETAAVTQERPLFSESSVLALQEQIALPPAQRGASEGASEETPVVHRLPPLIPEEVPQSTPSALASVPASLVEVVVKKGDTLDKIAKAHHVGVDEILKCNHLASSFLKVGQVLKMPEGKGGGAKALPKPAAAEALVVAGGNEYYTVKVGDNPWTIAMKNHMKVEELLKLNGLNEERARKLKPGDRLRIR